MSNHHKIPFNSDFIHHNKSRIAAYIQEVVFGVQDGMVSTLGAITGIAIGSQDHFTIILSGIAIIAVESISMSFGSYTSSLSEKHIAKRMLQEEMMEIRKYPDEEREELENMYKADGWPDDLAVQMSHAAGKDEKLMLKEMAYRELSVSVDDTKHPFWNGFFMFFSYVVGGLVPLSAYFFLSVQQAMYISIPLTLFGLFVLGAFTTKFTKQPWMKSGARMLFLGGVALLVGFLVGYLVDLYIS
jgi:VIT1/CCC1 family predicted Fe2+/Mn2+ transporter